MNKGAIGALALLAMHAVAYALNPSLDISQYAHTAWKIRDGFAKGAIESVAQTPDGYLWLGTELGLFRFDGVRAVPWQPPASEQLPSNYIGRLLIARDGTLWIGTLKGLASWKDGKLTNYPEVAGQVISALLEDHEGTIWIGAAYGSPSGELCAMRGAVVKCYGGGSFGRGVFALYEDRRGNLWVSAQTGIWRWAPGPPEHYAFPRGVLEANSLIESDSGTLLLATNDGLKELVNGKIQSYTLPGIVGKFRPSRLFRSSDGSFWVGSDQKLLHLHQDRIDTFGAADGLSGDKIFGIFEDREGTVWVSTANGLDRFREFAIPTISRNQGLSDSGAHCVQAMPDGSIWIGTPDGFNRWDNGHVTVYGRGNQPALGIGGAATKEIADSGLGGAALSLAQGGGRLWASTSEGIFYFHGGRFSPIPGVPGGNIWPIAADDQGSVWVSHADGGLFCVTAKGAVQRTPWARFNAKGPARVLLPDRGGLWLGFFDGGVGYFKDGQVGAFYNTADGLGRGVVSQIRLGSDGAIWVATEGGLSRVERTGRSVPVVRDLKDGRITTLSSKNGLPCDMVHWSMEDNVDAVWVYMPCGLVRIARSELEAWARDSTRVIRTTILDSSDGVESLGVYGGYGPHVTKSADGKIWFAARSGTSIIDPRHIPLNKLPPPVHIEQVIADRKAFDAMTEQHIPALTRDLEIDYTALSLVAPEKNRFRYKLEGYDGDWQDAGNRRQAFYTKLPPRVYTFRVKASNNSGAWNEAGASFTFSIDPAYYQTNWFKALCVAAFLALLWLLYLMRVRQLAREFSMTLDARVDERTRIARELHDTLLQSFQGLMLRLRLVEELLPEGKAKKELEKTLHRGEQAIVEGRTAVQDLRASTTTTNDLAQAVNALGDELAHDDRTTFRFVMEGTAHELRPIIRDELYRIAREALRNAFQHAQAEHVEVEITYGERAVRMRIRDDGRGMAADILEEGRTGHFGLPSMRERAKQMGAKLDIWSGLGAGTEIALTIAGAKAYASAPGHSRFRLFSKNVV